MNSYESVQSGGVRMKVIRLSTRDVASVFVNNTYICGFTGRGKLILLWIKESDTTEEESETLKEARK
ncbi:MAG: hypothetical protein J7J61_07130 [Candidatus Hydrothermae bacterium]|nr:hypothetical protein [Candidatus Hydrothermae bacterium]